MNLVDPSATLTRTSTSRSFSLTPDISSCNQWKPFVEDWETNSFSYYIRDIFPKEELDKWFDELHPSHFTSTEDAWSDAHYKGEKLLRKTSWVVLDDDCTCEYGYSDTWQPIAKSSRLRQIVSGLSTVVKNITGDMSINCCNLNYYPRGGGVGFHADDEFLFDGLNQNIRIISLSLCGPGQEGGTRKFQIRRQQEHESEDDVQGFTDSTQAIMLGHGDLMTMEGTFQKHYHHSVWPGDDKGFLDHPLAQGERINLTWRTIVKHLDGSEECRGMKCPLSES